MVFSGFADKNNCRVFWVRIEFGVFVIPTLGRDLICNAVDWDEEEELPTNYTNFHEKRIKAVLLFRHPAIQPCFSLKTNLYDGDTVLPFLSALTPLLVISTIGRDLSSIPFHSPQLRTHCSALCTRIFPSPLTLHRYHDEIPLCVRDDRRDGSG